MEVTQPAEINHLLHHPSYNATLYAADQITRLLGPMQQEKSFVDQLNECEHKKLNDNYLPTEDKPLGTLDERRTLIEHMTRISALEKSVSFVNHHITETVRKLTNPVNMKNIEKHHQWYRDEVTKRWDWVQQLLVLTHIHMNNGRDYHCFHLDLHSIHRITLFKHNHFIDQLKRLEGEECSPMASLQIFLTILPAMEKTFEELTQMARCLQAQADRIVPFNQRFNKQNRESQNPITAKLLCDYFVDGVNLPRGTDVTILSQEDKTTCTVQYCLNGQMKTAAVPAMLLWSPPQTKQITKKMAEVNEMICNSWASLTIMFGRVLLASMSRFFAECTLLEQKNSDSKLRTQRSILLLKQELLGCANQLKAHSKHAVDEKGESLNKIFLQLQDSLSLDVKEVHVNQWKRVVELYRNLERKTYYFLEEKKGDSRRQAASSNTPPTSTSQVGQDFFPALHNEHQRLKETIDKEMTFLKRLGDPTMDNKVAENLWSRNRELQRQKAPMKKVCIQKGLSVFQRENVGVQTGITTTDSYLKKRSRKYVQKQLSLLEIFEMIPRADNSSQMQPSRREKFTQLSRAETEEQMSQCNPIVPYQYEETFFNAMLERKQKRMVDEISSTSPIKIVDSAPYTPYEVTRNESIQHISGKRLNSSIQMSSPPVQSASVEVALSQPLKSEEPQPKPQLMDQESMTSFLKVTETSTCAKKERNLERAVQTLQLERDNTESTSGNSSQVDEPYDLECELVDLVDESSTTLHLQMVENFTCNDHNVIEDREVLVESTPLVEVAV